MVGGGGGGRLCNNVRVVVVAAVVAVMVGCPRTDEGRLAVSLRLSRRSANRKCIIWIKSKRTLRVCPQNSSRLPVVSFSHCFLELPLDQAAAAAAVAGLNAYTHTHTVLLSLAEVSWQHAKCSVGEVVYTVQHQKWPRSLLFCRAQADAHTAKPHVSAREGMLTKRRPLSCRLFCPVSDLI